MGVLASSQFAVLVGHIDHNNRLIMMKFRDTSLVHCLLFKRCFLISHGLFRDTACVALRKSAFCSSFSNGLGPYPTLTLNPKLDPKTYIFYKWQKFSDCLHLKGPLRHDNCLSASSLASNFPSEWNNANYRSGILEVLDIPRWSRWRRHKGVFTFYKYFL